MGKGDKRTKRGKLFKGSFGNSRPHTAKKTSTAATASKPAPAAKETPAKKERKPAAKKAKKE